LQEGVFLKKWEVEIKEENDKEGFIVEMIDASETFEEALLITDKFLLYLTDNVKERDNYVAHAVIEKITSPDGEDVTAKMVFFVYGEDIDGVKVGLLLGQLTDQRFVILALWPEAFIEACKKEKKLLETVVESILFAPERWSSVDIILPRRSALDHQESQEK